MILGDPCERVIQPPGGLRPTGWEPLIYGKDKEDVVVMTGNTETCGQDRREEGKEGGREEEAEGEKNSYSLKRHRYEKPP